MPTLAFWNLRNNVTAQAVTAFAHECDVDVLVLAENSNTANDLVRTLNMNSKRLFFADSGLPGRLTILTRFRPNASCLIRDSNGISIRHYQLPLGLSFLVVAAHLGSKLWKSKDDQVQTCSRVARYICEAEARVGHSRTIVIGDLNMNPFEAGVVGSEGLHAVMDRRIASQGSRRVQGEECKFFYNPMWSTFGDGDSTPPGTYFYNSGGEVNFFWNVFDQILVRPSLLSFLDRDAVRVVVKLNNGSLLDSNGVPDKRRMSDHLPIVCRLNELLEQENDQH